MVTFSRKLFIALILLTSFPALTAHKIIKNDRQIKQKSWNTMAAQVDTWVDGLGRLP